VDVLQLFSIANAPTTEKGELAAELVAVKTWNVERAQRVFRPGILPADNPDNADIAGPDSIYDYYA
jgi:hypothetical protein